MHLHMVAYPNCLNIMLRNAQLADKYGGRYCVLVVDERYLLLIKTETSKKEWGDCPPTRKQKGVAEAPEMLTLL